MKICYFADGRSIHFHRWIKFFADAGHEMQFISYQPVTDAQVKEIEVSGAQFLGTVGPFHVKRFWKTLRDLRWLKTTLAAHQVDVVHCHFLGVNTWYAALANHHPFVITVMGGGDVCGPDWRPQGPAARYLTPLALRRADLITSWSPLMAKVVRPYCREETPIVVLHGGINLGIFHPGKRPDYLYKRWDIPAGAPIIFSPRLMRPLSNLDRLAEALIRLHDKIPEAYTLFAYPVQDAVPDYDSRVREMIGASPAADRVRFIGTVPHHEMADHYRLASLTISIPSTDGTPMSVLESMACGTPAIVGNIPDYDRYYFAPDSTVLAVDPENPVEITGAMFRLLREPALAEKLTSEAKARVDAKASYEAQMSILAGEYGKLSR